MGVDDEKRWEMIERLIAAESAGKQPRLFSSQRTLFGIPSELDRELQAFAANSNASVGEAVEAGKSAGETAAESKVERATSDTSASDVPANQVASKRPQRVSHPLEPVFDERSRVLVLGTMPSPKSRETGFYYNHPQNRFWPVMARIFDEPVPQGNEQKRELCLKHGVALWDVLASCEIEGAKDGTIAECVPNNLALVTDKAPIEAVFCTGAKAAELYGRYCKVQTGMDCIKLPSTSPANAAWSLDDLVEAYRPIADFCR